MRKWELIHEKKLCVQSDMITTVDPQMAGRLSKFLRKEVSIIYNGFWDYYQSSNTTVEKQNKITFNHTGTLTTGQHIEFFLDALLVLFRNEKLSKENFQFNLIGLEYFPQQMKRLDSYQEMIGEIIFTTPRLPKKEAVEMNLMADYLVNFTDPNISAIYAKTYDYIACQKPILVIPGDNGLLDNLVTKNKLGKVLNSQDDIIELLLNPNVEYTPNKADTSFFTRKNQTEIFVKKIETLILKD